MFLTSTHSMPGAATSSDIAKCSLGVGWRWDPCPGCCAHPRDSGWGPQPLSPGSHVLRPQPALEPVNGCCPLPVADHVLTTVTEVDTRWLSSFPRQRSPSPQTGRYGHQMAVWQTKNLKGRIIQNGSAGDSLLQKSGFPGPHSFPDNFCRSQATAGESPQQRSYGRRGQKHLLSFIFYFF